MEERQQGDLGKRWLFDQLITGVYKKSCPKTRKGDREMRLSHFMRLEGGEGANGPQGPQSSPDLLASSRWDGELLAAPAPPSGSWMQPKETGNKVQEPHLGLLFWGRTQEVSRWLIVREKLGRYIQVDVCNRDRNNVLPFRVWHSWLLAGQSDRPAGLRRREGPFPSVLRMAIIRGRCSLSTCSSFAFDIRDRRSWVLWTAARKRFSPPF